MPNPEFVVFYNEEGRYPEYSELRFSDSFKSGGDSVNSAIGNTSSEDRSNGSESSASANSVNSSILKEEPSLELKVKVYNFSKGKNEAFKRRCPVVVLVKENQKRLLQAINREIERMETSEEIKELDKAEKITKEYGRLETVSMRMIDNTVFLYEEPGMALFYGSIARISIMDKKVWREKEEMTESRAVIIMDVESMSVENMLKINAVHWNIEM